MTRKDYVLLAEAFHLNVPVGPYISVGYKTAVKVIADALETDNPRFDSEHFLAMVCGEVSLDSKPTRKAKLA